MERLATASAKWKDPIAGTNNPFLPLSRNCAEDCSPVYVALNNYLLGPLLGTLRVILLVPIVLVWLAAAETLSYAQAPWTLQRLLDWLLGRVTLFLLGYLWLGEEQEGTPKRMSIRPAPFATDTANFTLHSLRPPRLSAAVQAVKSLGSKVVSSSPSFTVSVQQDTVRPGDWLLSNHCSWVDLIYIWWWCSARTTVVDASSSHRVYAVNRFYALLAGCGLVHSAGASSSSATRAITRDWTPIDFAHFKHQQRPLQPLLIFAEGTTSNGRGVLKFIPDLSHASLNQRIHLLGIKYDLGVRATACCPLPLPFSSSTAAPLLRLITHAWLLAAELSNSLAVRWLNPSALYTSSYQLPMPNQHEAFNRTLQQIVAALGHHRPLSLQAADKLVFLDKHFKDRVQ